MHLLPKGNASTRKVKKRFIQKRSSLCILYKSKVYLSKTHRGIIKMKHFVEFKMDDGSVILVEVDEPEMGGTTRAGRRPGEIVEEAKYTFEQALSKIRPATEKVISTLRGLAHKPDEIEMEFGFSLNAEAGVVIASASTAANYKVTLRWKQAEQKHNP
jgi:hypothetical protein